MPRLIKSEDKGITAVSYGLLLGLIGVVALLSITTAGSTVKDLFETTDDSLAFAGGNAEPSPAPSLGPVNNSGSFAFDDSTGAAGALVESAIVQVSGFENAAVSVSGDGSPQFRICADATCSGGESFGSSGTISDGEYLQLRLTASASNFTVHTANATVGAVSDDWAVTSGGTAEVLDMSGVWHPVVFTQCRVDGALCNEAEAKAACVSAGGRLVTHAGNTSSNVFSLGASLSCQHSVGYFRGTTGALEDSGNCLMGVSNSDWNPTNCCTPDHWHGYTFEFPVTNGSDEWGHIHSSNTGYNSSISSTSGSSWGCVQESSVPNGTPSQCTGDYYVACVQ
ncbi:MAG: hypothetical protein Alpg2KO_04880 [Alphaproteobacteria bacterium]